MTSDEPAPEGGGGSFRTAFGAALGLTCLLAIALLPAAWFDASRHPTYAAEDVRTVLGLHVAGATIGVLVAAAFVARSPTTWRCFAATLGLLAWAAFTALGQHWIRSPQLSAAWLLLAGSILGLLALRAPRAGRAQALHFAWLAAGAVLLGAELYVGRIVERRLPDYGDLYGVPPGRLFQAGGQLQPGLDLFVRGDAPGGRVHVQTNSDGFRNDAEVARPKPRGVRRIVLVGDSFFAGYRVDQQDALGARLAERLQATCRESGFEVEVLVARLDNPILAWAWFQEFGAVLEPDLVVLGVTLGNDPAECWAGLHPEGGFTVQGPRIDVRASPPAVGFTVAPLSVERLPEDAYVSVGAFGALRRELGATVRKLGKLKLLRGLELEPSAAGIGSWYGDVAGRVHTFDVVHGLGGYYARRPLPRVDEAFARLERSLAGLSASTAAAGVPLCVVPIGQRFEYAEREWRSVQAAYGLDPAAFELARPGRRVAEACARIGLEVIEIGPALRAEAERDQALFLPLGDMHWNRAGHEVVAETLARALLARPELRAN